MRTFSCICGNTLFFDSVTCLACGTPVGWCPQCRAITAWIAESPQQYRCGNGDCGALLQKCDNYALENVCNRGLLAGTANNGAQLCDSCEYNDTIPDLSMPGNWQKWARLEAAKRRLVFSLDLLALPRPSRAHPLEGKEPISFDFKADVLPDEGLWRTTTGEGERVYTGHANGKITINIREADQLEREKMRLELDETHRTLIGHFRHEIGHYYWDLLVKDQCEDSCITIFGNHDNPTYQQALERHYREGPPGDWRNHFVSAYASMHPWEDFAETFATYLDMISALDTASHMQLIPPVDIRSASLTAMMDSYRRLGIAMNEMNRAMGLIDYVPELFIPPVVGKISFVHDLLRDNAVDDR
ncbi:zinc-binding metallopeptidase family protein [Microbulbifer litoralis]|uniref:zinc-binding metallopeptidase family protein n=1 Tax=Microbulbifer litoralis TaxID=2933965 RepID=UPI0020288436|nr:putative zinc-binding metallopeptidase [Microbulbifer sp. GX H0434]